MKPVGSILLLCGLATALFGLPPSGNAYVLFQGDGSDEPGFVSPKVGEAPPPPPAHISSGESYIPYPGPPVVPQSRSEKKKPPSPPILFTKLTSKYGLLDWAARPNDLNNLLKNMKDMIDVNFLMEAKSLEEIDVDPDKNPILYRSGHFHFELTPVEREKLRRFLLNGGMIILNTGMGSKPFYDSARAELQKVLPEIPIQRLGTDHPIFHSYYDLGQVKYRAGVRKAGYAGNEPWLEGITINCRTVAVISRWCMSIGWDALDDDTLMGYSIESAQKLGINLMSYATAERAWAKQAANSMEFVDQSPVSAGKMRMAQIVYDGEWKTRHAGLSVLLQQFNQKTDVPVKFEHVELRLSDPKVFDSPLLYMTGHEDFRLKSDEIAGLREYLTKGGCLFAEACCGRKAFDAAFRREMDKVLPGQSFTPMPEGSTVFSLPNKISSLGVTPALASALGNKSTVAPRLLELQVEGHTAVIYSPFGMAGGWELSQSPYALGYDDAGALALGENVLMYAITQ